MTVLSKWRGSQWATLLTIILKDYLYVFSYRGRNLSAKTSVFSLIVKKKRRVSKNCTWLPPTFSLHSKA